MQEVCPVIRSALPEQVPAEDGLVSSRQETPGISSTIPVMSKTLHFIRKSQAKDSSIIINNRYNRHAITFISLIEHDTFNYRLVRH